MKVWAMTESEASTTSATCTSKMKWGFFRMLTQKRRGRLEEGERGDLGLVASDGYRVGEGGEKEWKKNKININHASLMK